MTAEHKDILPPSLLQDRLRVAFFSYIPSPDGVYKHLEQQGVDLQSIPLRQSLEATLDNMSQSAQFEQLTYEWEALTPFMNISDEAVNFIASYLDIIAIFGISNQEAQKPGSLYHALGLYKEDNMHEGAFSSNKAVLAKVERDLLARKKEMRNYYKMRLKQERAQIAASNLPLSGLDNVARMIAEENQEIQAWEEEYQRRYSSSE